MGASAGALVGGLIGVVSSTLLLLLLHFLMPREVLHRYWKEPHFRSMELALFSTTLFAPMRTIMLAWAIAFPGLGQRRKVAGIRDLVPMSYRMGAKAFCALSMMSMALLVLGAMGMALDLWLTGEDDRRRVQITIGLLVCLGSFGGVAVYQWCSRCHPARQVKKRRTG